MKNEHILSIKKEAQRIGVEAAALRAFIDVESGGRGFDAATGKLIIQFEPAWFRKKTDGEFKEYKVIDENKARGQQLSPREFTLWSNWQTILGNRVQGQKEEWQAFNAAFAINPTAAMESTSIGLGQVMGFHYKRLGYSSVGAMWDDAKKGEDRQIYQMAQFILTDNRLVKALREKNWHLVATYYNGAGYIELARRYGRERYDVSMRKAYERFVNLPMW